MALPSDYANLTGWWKADAGYYSSYPTLATNDQEVTRWDDYSGNARHMVNASYGAGYRPHWMSNVQNGLGVIRTSAASARDFYGNISSNGQAFNTLADNTGTAFTVFRRYAGSISATPWIFWEGTYGTDQTIYHHTNGSMYSYEYANTTPAAGNKAIGSWVIGTWMIDSTLLYCGNCDTRTASLTSVAKGTLWNGNLYTRSAAAFEDNDIAELIFYGRNLAESERMGVEGYLAAKWGISIPYGSGSFMLVM
jgi:hypothetical protein